MIYVFTIKIFNILLKNKILMIDIKALQHVKDSRTKYF